MHAALRANLTPGRVWLNACLQRTGTHLYLDDRSGRARCSLANNAHAQDLQNGVGVRGDLCHSSRTEAFRANSNLSFALHPTRSAVVVLEWS